MGTPLCFSVLETVFTRRRQGTVEEKATTRLLGGKTVKVVVQYTNTDPAERINKNLAIIRGLVSHRAIPTAPVRLIYHDLAPWRFGEN